MSNSKISRLKHKIVICSQKFEIQPDQELRFKREIGFETWALIEAKRGSFFSSDGLVTHEKRNSRSHCIIIRYRPEIEISDKAWIFQQRIRSSPRWFKILASHELEECGRWWKFDCRLAERSDDVSKPQKKVEDCQNSPTGPLPLPDGLVNDL